MSIKLRFQKGSYVTQVTLKDEALSAIHQLIATFQAEDEVQQKPEITPPVTEFLLQDLNEPTKQRPRIEEAKSWLAAHSTAEALAKTGWQTFAERILVLGAHYEARGGGEGWKSADVDALFKTAREAPPGNF